MYFNKQEMWLKWLSVLLQLDNSRTRNFSPRNFLNSWTSVFLSWVRYTFLWKSMFSRPTLILTAKMWYVASTSRRTSACLSREYCYCMWTSTSPNYSKYSQWLVVTDLFLLNNKPKGIPLKFGQELHQLNLFCTGIGRTSWHFQTIPSSEKLRNIFCNTFYDYLYKYTSIILISNWHGHFLWFLWGVCIFNFWMFTIPFLQTSVSSLLWSLQTISSGE